MSRRVLWSADALDDLAVALEYHAMEEPERALWLVDQIELAAARLGTHATGRPGRVAGTYEKSLPKLHYIIAYRLDDAAGLLHVLRVVHSSREWLPGTWPR